MDFSDKWKSLWSSSFVFRAPRLLIPNLSFLGPLVFHPSVQNLEPTILLRLQNLFSTPLPPTPVSFLHSNFIPLPLLCSLASDASSLNQPTPFQQNFLHVLHRSNGDLILFFTRGENLDCISYVVLTTQNQKFCITEYDSDNKIFTVCPKLGYQIFKIVVSTEENSTTASGNCVIEGYLVACTLYTVHWYRIESRVSCVHLEAPALLHLGFAELKSHVIHFCWNPHLQEESLVLLETGELRMFNLNHCSRFLRRPTKLHGSKVMVPLNDENIFGLEKENMSWLGCEFSWHPRVLIVARSDVVFLLDFRCKVSSLTILAKIELCDSVRHCLGKEDCFVSFSGAKFDKFFFSVATKYHLLLFDIRQPLIPILRWDHDLDDPTIAQMFKLSELRPSSSNCEFNWASESGFAILLGSLWNSEFNVYCYGPFFSSDGSVASKFNKLEHGVYAWGLPSKLSLLGYPCECGDCLVKEDFSKSKHPVGDSLKKKEKVLGFVVLSDDLLDKTHELNGLGGFTLIRLTSSGRLESQMYKASCDATAMKSKCGKPSLTCCCDSALFPLNHLCDFSFKFKYLRLDYLLSYSNGNLADVLISKMHPEGSSFKNMSNFQELPLLDALKTTQVSQSRCSLAFSDIQHEINYSTTSYEIAYRKLWTGLPLDLVQLAFVRRSDLYEERKKMGHLEFLLNVPSHEYIQLQLLYLKKPSSRSGKCLRRYFERKSDESSSQKLCSDDIVGPVLPLPSLYTFQHIGKDNYSSDIKEEVDKVCEEVANAVDDMVNHQRGSNSLSQEDSSSQVMQEGQAFFIRESLMNLDADAVKEKAGQQVEEPLFKEKKFGTVIFQKQEKNSSSDGQREYAGLEMFDDLCPIELNFDSPNRNLSPMELKMFKCVQKQYSKWQDGFKPYKDFCTSASLI